MRINVCTMEDIKTHYFNSINDPKLATACGFAQYAMSVIEYVVTPWCLIRAEDLSIQAYLECPVTGVAGSAGAAASTAFTYAAAAAAAPDALDAASVSAAISATAYEAASASAAEAFAAEAAEGEAPNTAAALAAFAALTAMYQATDAAATTGAVAGASTGTSAGAADAVDAGSAPGASAAGASAPVPVPAVSTGASTGTPPAVSTGASTGTPPAAPATVKPHYDHASYHWLSLPEHQESFRKMGVSAYALEMYKANAKMEHTRGKYGMAKAKQSIICSCATNYFGNFDDIVDSNFTFGMNANLKYSSGEYIFQKMYCGMEDMTYMEFRFPSDGEMTDLHKDYALRWRSVHAALEKNDLPVFYQLRENPRPLHEIRVSQRLFGGWPAYGSANMDFCYLKGKGRFALSTTDAPLAERPHAKKPAPVESQEELQREQNSFDELLQEELYIMQEEATIFRKKQAEAEAVAEAEAEEEDEDEGEGEKNSILSVQDEALFNKWIVAEELANGNGNSETNSVSDGTGNSSSQSNIQSSNGYSNTSGNSTTPEGKERRGPIMFLDGEEPMMSPMTTPEGDERRSPMRSPKKPDSRNSQNVEKKSRS